MDHFRLKAIHEQNKKRNEERYKEVSKRKLIDSVTLRLRTVMIGALARFENEFGALWGHNKGGPKTQQQLDLYNKWQKVRTEILDLGNNNIRDAERDIAQYTLSWNRYRTDFIIINKDKQEKE